jgi:site-specific recombinase XerD
MGRRRKSPSPYPIRVYPKHGSLYYVAPAGNWLLLVRGTQWNRDAAKAYAKATAEEPVSGTMTELIRECLKAREEAVAHGELSPRTLADNHAEAEKLIGFFGKMRPRDIKPSHIGDYKRLRGQQARIRCNRELSLLSSVFAYGLENGHVLQNPTAGIRRHKERPRTRLVADDEWHEFWHFAQGQGSGAKTVLAIANVAYLSNQRREDVLDLHLSQLKDEGIEFAQKKRNETVKVLVEWTPSLQEAIEYAKSLRRKITSLYLFGNRAGQHYTDAGFKAMWNRLQVLWSVAGHERFTFHDLRAKGISKMKEQGRKASEISGHLTESTAERVYDRRRLRKGKAVE